MRTGVVVRMMIISTYHVDADWRHKIITGVRGRVVKALEIKGFGVPFLQCWSCVKALIWQALNPHRLCPLSSNWYKVERELVLYEQLLLQKMPAFSPGR